MQRTTLPDIMRFTLAISVAVCMLAGLPCFGFQFIHRHGPVPSTFENMEPIAFQIRQAQDRLEAGLRLNPAAPPPKSSRAILDKYLAVDIPAAAVANANLELFKFKNNIEGHDLKKAMDKLQALNLFSEYPKRDEAIGKIRAARGDNSGARFHFQQAYEQDPSLFANLLDPDSPEKNKALIKAATDRIAKLMEAQQLTNSRLMDVADGIYQIGENSDDAGRAIEMFDQLFLSRAKTMDNFLRQHALQLQNRLYLKQAEYLAKSGADTKTQLAMLDNIVDSMGKSTRDFAIMKIFMRGGKDADLAGKMFDPPVEFDNIPTSFQLKFDRAVQENALIGPDGKRRPQIDWLDKGGGGAQYIRELLENKSQTAEALAKELDGLQYYLRQESGNKRSTPSPEFLLAIGELAMKLERYDVAAGYFDRILAKNAKDKKAIVAVIECYEKLLESNK